MQIMKGGDNMFLLKLNKTCFAIVIVFALLAACAGNKPKPTGTPETDPRIINLPNQKMAVVYTKGDPNVVGAQAIPALYASVSALLPDLRLKGIDFQIGALRARWPEMYTVPKDQWTGIWGLSIPDEVNSVPQQMPGTEVKIEMWSYGKVAQILHIGPYSGEASTVQRLMDFITKSGYEIAGSHEEEYLTPPGAEVQKTIIRYPIKKK
jgi:hypothetical protein